MRWAFVQVSSKVLNLYDEIQRRYSSMRYCNTAEEATVDHAAVSVEAWGGRLVLCLLHLA